MLFPESITRGLLRNADISPTNVYENQWALIIGINQYSNFTHLKYAVDDANSMKITLMTQCGFPDSGRAAPIILPGMPPNHPVEYIL